MPVQHVLLGTYWFLLKCFKHKNKKAVYKSSDVVAAFVFPGLSFYFYLIILQKMYILYLGDYTQLLTVSPEEAMVVKCQFHQMLVSGNST